MEVKNQHCGVPGCESPFYAKGLCQNHYTRQRRKGFLASSLPLYYFNPTCSLGGCDSIVSFNGFCSFHGHRQANGVDLSRPKGVSGELNVNWRGGVAEYPGHYKMKKSRIIVLERANYTCSYCGKAASQVHHKDFSKDNHSLGNLSACCNKCNSKMRDPSKPNKSKYRRLYGKSLKELSSELGKAQGTIKRMHNDGRIKNLLLFDIQTILR